jgi:hypothetical protein
MVGLVRIEVELRISIALMMASEQLNYGRGCYPYHAVLNVVLIIIEPFDADTTPVVIIV